MKLAMLVAMTAACAVDVDPPVAPVANELAMVPMVGPFGSIELACASTPPCGGTEWNDVGEMIHPGAPDCSEITSGPDLDVRIAGVGCSVPNPLAMARVDYQAYVRRGDGWWRSGRLVTTLEHHHCDSGVDIAIEPGNARIATTVDCQLAEQSETLDYLVMLDPVAPSASAAVLVGEHVVPKSSEGAGFDATLDVHWLDASTLSLDGPTTWRDADVENDGATMSYFEAEAPSPAGVWTVSRSAASR